MTQPFQPVIAELRVWREQGLTLPLWWRDDDAVTPTAALDRLLALAETFHAPLHLAVIPRPAEQALAARLQGAAQAFIIVHGWRHQNHAPPNEKKAEYGAHRPVAAMLEEATRAWHRVATLFGGQALPVFVPPWNRVCPAVTDGLASCGFAAISAFRPRQAEHPAAGLLQVNTHLDPIAWRAGGGLAEPAGLVADIVSQLVDRRRGDIDNSEPFGLLTHHLVHDEPLWSFVAALIEMLLDSGVARWAAPLNGH